MKSPYLILRKYLNNNKKLLRDGLINEKYGKGSFEIGDLVLKWDHTHDEKGKHTKFQHLWVGPFHITEKIVPSTYKIRYLQGREENLHVNGLVLKPYFI